MTAKKMYGKLELKVKRFREEILMSVTLKDIARETGLSVATVSKYINGVPLKEKNRIAVEQAIRKLGYTVNEYARGLKSNKSRTIGVVIPELGNLFISNIISHMEEILRTRGYSVIICDCHSNVKEEEEAVQFLLSKMIDGIINMPTCEDGHHLLPAMEKNIPIVLVDRMIPQLSQYASGVFVNNEDAAYAATKLFLESGHKDIGIVVGPGNVYTSRCRLAGYLRAMSDYQLPRNDTRIAYSDYTVQSGYECTRALLEANPSLSAILLTNYELTLGGVIAINEMNIRIPDDISVIGFDHQDLFRVMHPQLTIVTQPLEAIGSQVAKVMLERLTDPNAGTPFSVSLPTAIHHGQSIKMLI